MSTIEVLPQYDLAGNRITDIARADFYAKSQKEWAEQGKITTCIPTACVLLVHPTKGALLQKRAADKSVNPSLWDFTVVGHISVHETPDSTCVRECAEELGIAAHIVPHSALAGYKETPLLAESAYVSHIKTELIHALKRHVGVGDVLSPCMTENYFGYYTGAWQFPDGEVEEARYFTINDLRVMLRDTPELLVPDAWHILNVWEEGRTQVLEQAHYRLSMKAVILNEEGKILLSKQRAGDYDFPGGGLDHGEDPETCLKREILEETGLIADHVDPVPLRLFTFSNKKYGHVANLLYKVTGVTGEFQCSDECAALEWLSLEELERVEEGMLHGVLPEFRQFWREKDGVL